MSFPDFAWACGEASSDPVVLHGRGVRVDELAPSGHLGAARQPNEEAVAARRPT